MKAGAASSVIGVLKVARVPACPFAVHDRDHRQQPPTAALGINNISCALIGLPRDYGLRLIL